MLHLSFVDTLILPRRPLIGTRTSAVHVAIRPEDLRQAPLILAIFIVTQLLDGALTYWGVTRYGVNLEMNSLLAATIREIGPGAALFAAKGLACMCGIVLYVNLYLRPLAAVAGLCLGVAVIPWIAVATYLQ
jgi:hypothetical protein